MNEKSEEFILISEDGMVSGVKMSVYQGIFGNRKLLILAASGLMDVWSLNREMLSKC